MDGTASPEETKKALEKREKASVKVRTTENRLYRFWTHWLTDGEYPHVFVVDVATKKLTDLTPGNKRYFGLDEGGNFSIAPDGSSVVFAANSDARAVHDAELGSLSRARRRRRAYGT